MAHIYLGRNPLRYIIDLAFGTFQQISFFGLVQCAENCRLLHMKSHSLIRVTALQSVRIYAMVMATGAESAKPEYIDLKPGETRSDISFFLGIDPTHLPGEEVLRFEGTECVPYLRRYISPAFKALVQVEDADSRLDDLARHTA